MAKLNTENTTITMGFKEMIGYLLGIIFAMLALFYTFYNFAMNNMNEKHDAVVKTIEKIQSDLDQTKGNVGDVRDMQIKQNTYLEIILKQTIDKVPPKENTKGDLNHR